MAERPEIGIVCKNPEALQGRLYIADGIEAIPRDEAVQRGFMDNPNGALVPTEFRPATPDEVKQYTISPDGQDEVRWPLHLVRVPRGLAKVGISALAPLNGLMQPIPFPDQDLAPGVVDLKGRWVNAGDDKPNAETTCWTQKKTGKEEPPGKKVGIHLDVYFEDEFPDLDEPSVRYMVVVDDEKDSGPRLHTLVPRLTYDAIGQPVRKNPKECEVKAATHEYVDSRGADSFKVIGVELRPGEAILGSPTTDIAHDGFMLPRWRKASRAALATIQVPPFGTFESVA